MAVPKLEAPRMRCEAEASTTYVKNSLHRGVARTSRCVARFLGVGGSNQASPARTTDGVRRFTEKRGRLE
jgi:hypothetical protein